jgi:hypothetical protein
LSILVLGIIIVIVFSLFFPNFISSIIERGYNSRGMGVATNARLLTYEHFTRLSIFQKITGVGIGNVPSYMNGVAYILSTTGIIGLILTLFVLIDAFRNTRNFQRILCIVFFFLLLVSNIFYSVHIVFFFMFIYSEYRKKYINQESNIP